MMAETFLYTSPDGTTYNFSTNNISGGLINQGLDGRSMPPNQMLTDTVPLADGALYRGQNFSPRPLSLALTFVGTTRSSVRALMRSLASSMNPKKSATADSAPATGVLTVTTEDSVTRYINCNYVGGLESADVNTRPTMQKLVLNFMAPDPFWYGPTISQNFTISSTSGLFFPVSINPFALSSSAVFYQAIISNNGDVPADITWSAVGPGADLVVSNLTSSESLGLIGYTLPAGAAINISTSAATVERENGSDLYGSLTTRNFWRLRTGSNLISVQFTATSSATVVQMNYHERYLGI